MPLLDLFTVFWKIIISKYWHILNIQTIERTITHLNVYVVKLLEKNVCIITLQLDLFMDNPRNLRKTYCCVWKYVRLLVSGFLPLQGGQMECWLSPFIFLFLANIYLVFPICQILGLSDSINSSLWVFLGRCMGFIELRYKEAIHINKVS